MDEDEQKRKELLEAYPIPESLLRWLLVSGIELSQMRGLMKAFAVDELVKLGLTKEGVLAWEQWAVAIMATDNEEN